MGRKVSDYKVLIEGIVYSLKKEKTLSGAEVENIYKSVLRGKTLKHLCDENYYGKNKI